MSYVKLHRLLNDNPLWLSEPFTKAQAWIDLFMNANWKPRQIEIRGNQITVGRGQLGWSELTMAKRWQWSRMKVRRFLAYLEDIGNIVQEKSHLITVITICNYEKYQSEEVVDGLPNAPEDGQPDMIGKLRAMHMQLFQVNVINPTVDMMHKEWINRGKTFKEIEKAYTSTGTARNAKRWEWICEKVEGKAVKHETKSQTAKGMAVFTEIDRRLNNGEMADCGSEQRSEAHVPLQIEVRSCC